jgi:hypothetical protein
MSYVIVRQVGCALPRTGGTLARHRQHKPFLARPHRKIGSGPGAGRVTIDR